MSSGKLQFGDLKIEGCSRAGEGTWFRVRPPGFAFDVGLGAPQLAGAESIFLTHGHLDHLLGIPFVLSRRSLHRLSHTRVYCPSEIAGGVEGLIRECERLEEVSYQFELVPLKSGDRVEVARDLTVEAFSSEHVVPSLGYHLWRQKRSLLPDLRSLPPGELAAMRGRGERIDEIRKELWLSYPGDTGPNVFESNPELYSSRILLLECTFLCDSTREAARKYGHTHIEDLAERQHRFRSEAIVLHHLSRRHRLEELRESIQQLLPALASRIHLLSE